MLHMKKVNKFLFYCLLSFSTVISIIKVPEYHYSYIRNKGSQAVVKITDPLEITGGTGFHIRTEKGNNYILTNGHICGLAKLDPNGNVYVKNLEEDRLIPRKVIEVSNFADLCLVEGIPDSSVLTLGGKPSPGDELFVVGHPRLFPTTMTHGEYIGELIIDIFDYVNTKIYLTNVNILPGNSGSPVLNKYGNVVGVAFASQRGDNWGLMVSIDEINKFLKHY